MMQGAASPGGTQFAHDGVELDLMDAPHSPSHAGSTSLEFQEIAHTGGHADSPSLLHPDGVGSSASASSLPLPAGGSSSAPGLSAGSSSSPRGAAVAHDPNASFYQLAYYTSYFDVSTSQILSRLVRSLLPFRGKFYADEDRADLYGPFWIATTLIFLLAAAGNFANYIEFINKKGEGPDAGSATGERTVWSYDFRKVTLGASVFYSWISIVPLLVYCFFKRVGGGASGAGSEVESLDAAGNPVASSTKGLVEIASYFGYALTPLLPVCILCIPPLALVRWVSVGVAFLFSTFFLLSNLGTMDVSNKTLLPVIIGVLVLNFAIALLTKFYFFDF